MTSYSGRVSAPLLLLLAFALLALPSQAFGAGSGIVVDRNSTGAQCNDSRGADATAAAPLCSIARALAVAPAGATIQLRAGTYPQVKVDGYNPSATVSIQPYGSEKPTVQGFDVDRSSRLRITGLKVSDLAHFENVSNINFSSNDVTPHGLVFGVATDIAIENNKIHDLTMRIDPATGNCVESRCGFGIRVNTSARMSIRNNRFTGIPADGIQFGHGITDTTVAGNVFEWIKPSVRPEEHSDSIQVAGDSTNLRIESNLFHHVRGPILQDYNGVGVQRGFVLANNAMVQMRSWSLNLHDAPAARIVGNTIWDGADRITIIQNLSRAPMTGVVMVNNIIGELNAPASVFAREDYNIVETGLRGGAHDVATKPVFVNTAALDYQLRSNSTGVDSGTSVDATAFDLAGLPRVSLVASLLTGDYVDRGAYELQPGGPSAPYLLAGPEPKTIPAAEPPGGPKADPVDDNETGGNGDSGGSSGGSGGTTPPPTGGGSGSGGGSTPTTPVPPVVTPPVVTPPVVTPPTTPVPPTTPTAPGRTPAVSGLRLDDARRSLADAGAVRLRFVAVHTGRPSGVDVGDVLSQSPAAGSKTNATTTLRYYSGTAKPKRTCKADELDGSLTGMDADLAIRIVRDFYCKPELALVSSRSVTTPSIQGVADGSSARAPRVTIALPSPGADDLSITMASGSRLLVRDDDGDPVAGASLTVDRAGAAALALTTDKRGAAKVATPNGTRILAWETNTGVTDFGSAEIIGGSARVSASARGR